MWIHLLPKHYLRSIDVRISDESLLEDPLGCISQGTEVNSVEIGTSWKDRIANFAVQSNFIDTSQVPKVWQLVLIWNADLRQLEQKNQCTNSTWSAKQDIKPKKHLLLVRVICNPSGQTKCYYRLLKETKIKFKFWSY